MVMTDMSLDFMLKVVMKNKPKKGKFKEMFDNSEGATPFTFHVLKNFLFGDDQYEQRFDNFGRFYEVIDHDMGSDRKPAHLYIRKVANRDAYLVHVVGLDASQAILLLQIIQNHYFQIKRIIFNGTNDTDDLVKDTKDMQKSAVNDSMANSAKSVSANESAISSLNRGLDSYYSDLIDSVASSSNSVSVSRSSHQSVVASVISTLEMKCPNMGFNTMASLGNKLANIKSKANSIPDNSTWSHDLFTQLMQRPNAEQKILKRMKSKPDDDND